MAVPGPRPGAGYPAVGDGEDIDAALVDRAPRAVGPPHGPACREPPGRYPGDDVEGDDRWPVRLVPHAGQLRPVLGDERHEIARAVEGVGVDGGDGVAEVDPEAGGEELPGEGQVTVPQCGPPLPQVQAEAFRLGRVDRDRVDAHDPGLCPGPATPSCRCFRDWRVPNRPASA